MSSCFGRRRIRLEDEEALLPVYEDDTVLQRRLHQKLHSYQMVRALTQGFMPSNEQLLIILRTLTASDVLNPDTSALSDSGRLLAKYAKRFVDQFSELLQHKNNQDQVQDFIWCLTKSRVLLDTQDISNKVAKAKVRADSAAAYSSLQTVGSLLLTNSDFRIFLADLQTVARDIFKDSVGAVSSAADGVSKKLEDMPAGPDLENGAPSETPQAGGAAPTTEDLESGVTAVSKVVKDEAIGVGKTTKQSVEEHISGDEPQALADRLKKAVLKLRQRPDYNESVSTISLLIKRYALAYSRAVENTAETIQEDVNTNKELDLAMSNFWSLITSFGNEQEWRELEKRFKQLYENQKQNPEFEQLMTDIGNAIQKLLTDPSTLDDVNVKIKELRARFEETKMESNLRSDADALLDQIPRVMDSVAQDQDVHNLWTTTLRIVQVLFPAGQPTNSDLLSDSINVFVPLLIQAIQYIPVPRVEVSTPEIDLLLENLIIEPGKTVNHSSFLPFRFRAETYNDVELHKTHTLRTVSKTKSLLTIKLDGLTVRAEELGFWLRAHSGIFRLADEGIASFELDERGMDIHIDIEIGREQMEHILTLRDVRVHIHKLNYTLRKSKFACLAWFLKLIIRPIVRKVMEKQLANAIADFFHAANRELLYARERLRATRISDPKDLMTFFKAIAARLTPPEDPDLYSRVGIEQPGKGVFKGVYAPGSVVKLWNEEARQAKEHINDEWDRGGWRNEAFDTPVVPA